MIKIGLNDELSDYLNNRKKGEEEDSRFSGFINKMKEKFTKTKMTKEKLDYEDVEEYEELPKKRSLMSRIFRRSPKIEDEEYIESEEEQVKVDTEKEELKELVKILHRWIEKLPSDKINEFKRSSDFEKYKSGLKKLNMIK